MKKILTLVITVLLLVGCTKEEKDPMMILCDEIEVIANDYLNKNINSSDFIRKVNELNSKCTTSDYLCTEMKTFKNLDNNLREEILEAHAEELNRDCQYIRDKK